MTGKVVISINTTWNLVNFRSGLISALIHKGYDVVAVAPSDKHLTDLKQLGCRFIHLSMDNMGTNPVRDSMLFVNYLLILWKEKPDVYLGYTIKPNIYGSLAAHFFNIPVINNIAGLGASFIRESWVTSVVRWLYKISLFRSHHVFFQNQDDLEMFVGQGLVRLSQSSRLPGSGVNLLKFAYSPVSTFLRSDFKFLMVARLLWDKGVSEYVNAARRIRLDYPHVRFQILGFLDVENPTAVTKAEIQQWIEEGVVEYLGESDNVGPFLVDADCVVLPSYREGVPRSLLEAAAVGRPIVTTNAVGCRDVVDDGETGFLCNVRDEDDLAEKMRCMLGLPIERRSHMGLCARNKMEREFDERKVIVRYLELIESIG